MGSEPDLVDAVVRLLAKFRRMRAVKVFAC